MDHCCKDRSLLQRCADSGCTRWRATSQHWPPFPQHHQTAGKCNYWPRPDGLSVVVRAGCGSAALLRCMYALCRLTTRCRMAAGQRERCQLQVDTTQVPQWQTAQEIARRLLSAPYYIYIYMVRHKYRSQIPQWYQVTNRARPHHPASNTSTLHYPSCPVCWEATLPQSINDIIMWRLTRRVAAQPPHALTTCIYLWPLSRVPKGSKPSQRTAYSPQL